MVVQYWHGSHNRVDKQQLVNDYTYSSEEPILAEYSLGGVFTLYLARVALCHSLSSLSVCGILQEQYTFT